MCVKRMVSQSTRGNKGPPPLSALNAPTQPTPLTAVVHVVAIVVQRSGQVLGRFPRHVSTANSVCCVSATPPTRPPGDLYKGGLSRQYFEPFIKVVDERLLQLRVAGKVDYRMAHAAVASEQQPPSEAASMMGRWLMGSQAGQLMQQDWQQMMVARQQDGIEVLQGEVQLALPFGRSLYIGSAALLESLGGCRQQQLLGARFTFEELCGAGGSRPSLTQSGDCPATHKVPTVASALNTLLYLAYMELQIWVCCITVKPGSAASLLDLDLLHHC